MSTVAPVASAQQAPSAIDLAQARPLLNEAFELREKGDLAGALERFKAAHSLAETPITGTELGRTYMAVGKLVEARETLLSVARIPRRSAETERSVAARAESAQLAEQLRPRIPSVIIKVTGVPEASVTVTIDGATIPADALAAPRFLDPGSHALAATSAGREAALNVELKEGEVREVVLKIDLPAPPASQASAGPSTADLRDVPPATPTPSPLGQAQRVTGLVVAALGVAGLGASGVVGLVAKSHDVSAAAETFPAKHDDSLNASHLANAATIVAGGGAAMVVIGGLFWFTAPRTATAVGTSGSAVWLRGSF
jgi:hypothetical protein